MNAKNTTTVYSRKREALQDVIPLSTPFWICIDPSSACNIKCNYCVHYDVGLNLRKDFYKGLMPLDLAKKMVDDLSEFEKPIKVVSWYGWGEPLLNPAFPEMIEYSRKSGRVISTETITNGLLLTNELSDKLIDAGLQRMNISVQSVSAEGYFDICGKRIDFEKFVDNIRYIYEHKGTDLTVYIKIGNTCLKSETDKRLFYDVFGNICDEIFVEQIINVREDRSENDNLPSEINQGVFGQEVIEREVCPYLFYRMMVTPDGLCALCNADWYREFSVGNAKEQSLKDIWQGSILRENQITHLKGERSNLGLCSKCGNIKYYPVENLDPFRNIILGRYNTIL